MKYVFLSLLLVGLTSCSTWNPNLGMTTSDFDSMCFKSGLSYKSSIVQAEGNKEVRVCGGSRSFYYFDNGKLIRIDQGQLPQQRLNIEIK
jgi:hypothetical protein